MYPMLNKSKTRRLLVVAFLGITLILATATGWLYVMVQAGYGASAAFLALMIITMFILGLICKGIQYAAALEKALQGAVGPEIKPAPTPNSDRAVDPGISGQGLFSFPHGRYTAETDRAKTTDENESEIPEPGFAPRRRRGKHSRFPISRITKAVLAWERRDPQFTALTLTEFLEQEFGSGPDGILLMAPTTFYDWRRRVLRDLASKDKNASHDQGITA